MTFLIIIIALFAVMWLLMIRPQRRRQQEQARTIANVQVDDEIVTAGGLYGYVRALAEDEVTVEIAPDINVRIARRAIAGVVRPEQVLEAHEEGDELEEAETGEREPLRRLLERSRDRGGR